MKRLIFDIESDGLLDTATRIWCVGVRDVDTNEAQIYYDGPIQHPNRAGGMQDFLRRLESSEDLWIGHNINQYDLLCLQKVYPDLRIDHLRTFDTLVVSRVLYFNLADRDFRSGNRELIDRGLVGLHGLEAWGVRLGVPKNPSPDFSKLSREMLDYCAADTRTNRSLFLKEWAETKEGTLRFVSLEQEFSKCMDQVMSMGVAFDYEAAQKLDLKLKADKLDAEADLRNYPEFGDWTETYETKVKKLKREKKIIFNPTSRAHIEYVLTTRLGFQKMIRVHPKGRPCPKAKDEERMRKWLQECKTTPPEGADPTRLLELTDTGKAKIEEDVLESIVEQVPAARALNSLLLIQRRISQLRSLMLACGKDGRIHGQIGHAGTVSGRCNHFKPNLAQVPACDAPYGPEFRALFRASPGFKFIGADAKGLELRGLSHFLAPYDQGEYAKVCTEGDPHTANQRAAQLATRAQAKTFIYAMVYGAGARKIGLIVGRDEAAGKLLKETWMSNTPGAEEFFESIPATLLKRDQAFYQENHWNGSRRLRLKPNAHLRGIDGRPLYIRALHSAPNTLIQSWGAVVMKMVTVLVFQKAKERGWVFGKDWGMVLHVHDEMQCEARSEIADEFRTQVLACFGEAGVALGCRVKIDGDAKVGDSWADTH